MLARPIPIAARGFAGNFWRSWRRIRRLRVYVVMYGLGLTAALFIALLNPPSAGLQDYARHRIFCSSDSIKCSSATQRKLVTCIYAPPQGWMRITPGSFSRPETSVAGVGVPAARSIFCGEREMMLTQVAASDKGRNGVASPDRCFLYRRLPESGTRREDRFDEGSRIFPFSGHRPWKKLTEKYSNSRPDPLTIPYMTTSPFFRRITGVPSHPT